MELGLGLECRSARPREAPPRRRPWRLRLALPLGSLSAWGAEWAGFVTRAGSSQ